MLKRYKKIMSSETGYRDQMLVRPDGHWAKYDEAKSEIARLQAEVERTNDVLESQAHVIIDLKAEVERLRGLEVDTYNTWKLAIAKSTDAAWKDAIEAAAERVEELWAHTTAEHIIAIRALKRPKEPQI